MSSRDERLAQKYAAQGKKSANQTNREKRAARNPQGSTMDTMREMLAQPRTQESRQRAGLFKRNLPRLP